MRIISGKYKGKKIQGFDIKGTRPTMDRVKESLFAMIFPYLKDAVCLDLFAGSGSLGIEAISNGASSCIFVDNNIQILKILKNNIKNIPNCQIVNSDFISYLKKSNQKFDIIFLDPPYANNWLQKCLDIIVKQDLLNDNGLIICEYETEQFKNPYPVIKEKKYGTTNIRILKK